MVSQTSTMAANFVSSSAVTCPTGSQSVFGSCTTDQLSPVRNVTLRQAGIFAISPQDWSCFFRNHEGVPVTIRASAVCLKPPS